MRAKDAQAQEAKERRSQYKKEQRQIRDEIKKEKEAEIQVQVEKLEACEREIARLKIEKKKLALGSEARNKMEDLIEELEKEERMIGKFIRQLEKEKSDWIESLSELSSSTLQEARSMRS